MIVAFFGVPVTFVAGVFAPGPTLIALALLLAGSVMNRRGGGKGL